MLVRGKPVLGFFVKEEWSDRWLFEAS